MHLNLGVKASMLARLNEVWLSPSCVSKVSPFHERLVWHYFSSIDLVHACLPPSQIVKKRMKQNQQQVFSVTTTSSQWLVGVLFSKHRERKMTASLKATDVTLFVPALSMLAFRANWSAILSDLKHSQEAQRLEPRENFVQSTPHPPGVSSSLSLSLSLFVSVSFAHFVSWRV